MYSCLEKIIFPDFKWKDKYGYDETILKKLSRGFWKKLKKHRSIGPFSNQNGRQSQKMGKKMKILALMDLNCLKTAINWCDMVHGWKAYLTGYNFATQKFCLKCNPDFWDLFL